MLSFAALNRRYVRTTTLNLAELYIQTPAGIFTYVQVGMAFWAMDKVQTHVCEEITTNAPCCRLTPECCACAGGWCCNHHRLGWHHAAPVEGVPESAAKRPLQDQSRRRVEPARVNRCYGVVRTGKNSSFHLADRDRDLRGLLCCPRTPANARSCTEARGLH
jgi:hypothetical protein